MFEQSKREWRCYLDDVPALHRMLTALKNQLQVV